ncbi:MAG: DUF1549 and DUF1553 domain-containing protein [Gemmataceae bacterium]|nr:DUF1549 and DUF1553 domain-containing protein [Gemmataceae bacterium]MDW8267359.1 DUF1549 and DUF1553 domain-containing protein [Gemmataceae bacterium]
MTGHLTNNRWSSRRAGVRWLLVCAALALGVVGLEGRGRRPGGARSPATEHASARHWAFVPPQMPRLPSVQQADWPRNPIDYFILQRLEAAGLRPSPEADRTTLIRRVTLDLTGLPPTPEEVDAFLADTRPRAYERLVVRLLQSPRFGEHMARYWLDAARYADTHGLHSDDYSAVWPYREWVITAFNRNLPFDQFLIEQLAGDLLPHATPEQQIATGFLRCHLSSTDAALAEEEVRVGNMVDITETTAAVTLGLTFSCARCHDHKYDPLSMRDYYSFYAFFNSFDGSPYNFHLPAPPPAVAVPSPRQQQREQELYQRGEALRREIAAACARCRDDVGPDRGEVAPLADQPRDYVWFDDELPRSARILQDGVAEDECRVVRRPEGPVFSGESALRIKSRETGRHYVIQIDPPLVIGPGDRLFCYVYLDPDDPPAQVMLQWRTRDFDHRASWGEDLIPHTDAGRPTIRHFGALPKSGEWVRLEVAAEEVGLAPGAVVDGIGFAQYDGTVYWDATGSRTRLPVHQQTFDTLAEWLAVQRRLNGARLPPAIRELALKPDNQRTPEQRRQLRDFFLQRAYRGNREVLEPLLARLAEHEDAVSRFYAELPQAPVYRDAAMPRPTFILRGGQFDRRGSRVEPAVPACLPPLPADAPRNRLGLARWLVSPQQPLTARVIVNRFWQQFFGTGLVRTVDDFGLRGEPPSHPELLDWLACRFQRDGWNVKHLVYWLVTSATYRQTSRASPEARARDPENRLLSRGSRLRLDAEVLRDQALFCGGLLVEEIGGPSVKPPQPPGLWEAVVTANSNTGRFVADVGPQKVYRRSLYTFWKRTAPPPQMTILDAPSRETCVFRRERMNTPLQALVMLNDPQWVEAARGMAERAWAKAESQRERLVWLFRLAVVRRPDAAELAELEAALGDLRRAFERRPPAAAQLVGVGERPVRVAVEPTELAAWTMLAHLILNLDEVVTRE